MTARIELIPKAGACLASKNGLEGRGRVRWMVREQSQAPVDNGWRIFSDIDTSEYLADPANLQITDYNDVCAIEPALIGIWDMPVGSDLQLVDDELGIRIVDTPVDPVGDERHLLGEYLRWQRETLAAKCADLSPEQLATRSVEPSTISLLGLVRHMARVERGWFRQCVEGEDVATLYRGPGNMDGEWDDAVGTQECVDDAFATWQAECLA